MPSRLILATVVGALVASSAAAATLFDSTVSPAAAAQPPAAPVVPDAPAAQEGTVDRDPVLAGPLVPDLDLDAILADVERAVAQSVDPQAIEAQVASALATVDVDGIVARARQGVEGLLGPTPYLGIAIRDLAADEAKGVGLEGIAGAWVTEVTADAPAGEAGLAAGDVILRVDGQDVRGARHLSRIIAETPAGRALRVEYARNGQRQSVTVTPAQRARAGRFARGERAPREFSFDIPPVPPLALAPLAARGRLGIGVMDLTPQLATYFGVQDGVLVTSVREDSAAARGGLKAGDVITKVGARDVGNVRDLTRALGDVDSGGTVEIELSRERKTTTVTVSPDNTPTRQRIVVRPRSRQAAE